VVIVLFVSTLNLPAVFQNVDSFTILFQNDWN